VVTVTAIIVFLHRYSYSYLESSIVSRRQWDLKVCCGTTDGGGVNVVYVLPPSWDPVAALNIWEHKRLFLTVRKVHHTLPRCTPLPFARKLQARIGQRVTA
jgi:hypothetical protein